MRIAPLMIGIMLICAHAFSEGTREVAPNGSIVINGNNTTDIAALHIDNSQYNNFATYTNPDPNSRLYIHIVDPTKECVFLGLSYGHSNQNMPNPTSMSYEYRVRDPNGNVVFGPVTVAGAADANIANWNEAVAGPMQIYGAGGYDAVQISSGDLMSQGWNGEGDYFIEFEYAGNGTGLLIDYWDISVADCTQSTLAENKGRIWSYNWSFFAVNDFGFPNRPFNGAFYVCAPDPDNEDAAFITKINFNGAGFRPAAFNVAFNSFGSMNTGNVMTDRRSRENINSTQSEYAVFLNDPVDLCETAETGDVQLLGVSRCDAEDFCIKYIASKEGQIDLLLDFDGPDDIYTPGTADVMIAIDVPADEVGEPSCVSWDGLDGLGAPLDENSGTAIPVVISYAQGIYHFPIYDAEFMTTGFVIEAVRPAGPQPLLYYDDSQISVASGTGEPAVQLTGCMPPCHGWTVFNDANIPGFGNLNTINSWWFSQRVLRSEVFFLPAYLECAITGPSELCENETTFLTWDPVIAPEGADVPEIIAFAWSGPDILSGHETNMVEVGNSGTYTVDVTWVSAIGDTCMTSCSHELSSLPVTYGSFDTLIVSGDVIDINGQMFSEGGQFVQTLTGTNGCDSILTIRISLLQTAVYFSLDACNSFPSIGTDSVYTEFVAEYPEPVSCAGVEAGIAHRENPGINKHSCTPGVNDSPGICFSAADFCEYVPGDDRAFVFNVTLTPSPDTAVVLTGLSFYERAPLMYDWIQGPTGPNNYPTLYAVRVLRDGNEIFRQVDIPATADWSEEVFDFDAPEFTTDVAATFTFELLGYCLVGNGEPVAAWDVDEIRVQASCALTAQMAGDISGRIFTEYGERVKDVRILLSEGPDFDNAEIAVTGTDGVFMFEDNPAGNPYYLRAEKNTDFREGVTTLDLITLQKHLLGIRLFDSPMQYLAADINGNRAVSILDVVDLRRLLLGQFTEFPHNTSWRFGKAGQQLPLTQPWDFEQTIWIPGLSTDVQNVNFFGVKIGDVNRSLAGLQDDIEVRTPDAWGLNIEDREVQAGVPVEVMLTADTWTELAGIQLTLTTRDAQVLSVAGSVIDLDDEQTFRVSGELVRVVWSSAVPVAVSEGEALIVLRILPQRDGKLGDMVHFAKDDLAAEAYLGDMPLVADLQLHVRTADKAFESKPMYATPNPFREETLLHFTMQESGVAVVRILDVNGRLLRTVEKEFSAGNQTLSIVRPDLAASGNVLFCQLESQGSVETIRLVLLK